ncbi:MAG: type II toxin-antitoxin system RelE/ParE family toxin [Fibromonadales bacterium]|nr:type II toxin-antitoxin system RelE/ParE family toxin [Fibromonadales bacterium]
MPYNVLYSKHAEKYLDKIPKNIANRIVGWMGEKIDGKDNPRLYGKPLKGKLKDYWRYRVGDYRIICDIMDKELIVLALDIGPRGDVYK